MPVPKQASASGDPQVGEILKIGSIHLFLPWNESAQFDVLTVLSEPHAA